MLRAVGIEHTILSSAEGAVLVVPAREGLRAGNELAAYAKEQQDSKPVTLPAPPVAESRRGALCYVALLVVFFFAQHQGWAGLPWTAAGRTEATLITGGAWWRCVTALCLHGDVPHLAGNLFFGLLFGVFVCQLFGNGVGWLLIVLGGALGNGANAFIQLAEHRSLGASTAVFAALGLLVSCSFRRASIQGRSRMLRWAPLAAGLALFGLLGVEGENTDVLAHVTGMVCGGVMGSVFTAIARAIHAPSGPLARPYQHLAAAATFC
ncbi:MAG: rhomboid protease GluP, partial [Pseudohongiellaceae bacterium]